LGSANTGSHSSTEAFLMHFILVYTLMLTGPNAIFYSAIAVK